MKLYIVAGAPNARKTQAVLNHLELNPEIIKKDFFTQEMKQDDYLAINPNAKVPVLVDGDRTLWESEAINIYLASEKAPQGGLFNEQDRPDILKWQFWSTAHYNRWLAVIVWQTIVRPMFMQEEPDQNVIDFAMGYFPEYARILDEHLEGRQFMVGNDWTLADYSMGVLEPFVRHEAMPFDIATYKNVAAFYDRMAENQHWMRTAVTPEEMGRAA